MGYLGAKSWCHRATVHGLVLRVRTQGGFARVARARAVCRLGKVSVASLPQPTEAMEERSDRSSPLNYFLKVHLPLQATTPGSKYVCMGHR